jgi:hypothetical protein
MARSGRSAVVVGLGAVAAVVMAVVFSVGSLASTVAHTESTAGAVPLTAGMEIGSSTWLTMPMGNLKVASDTFWELFVDRSPGRWSLVTPPGVASNGGLSLASNGSSGAIVGVHPSNRLTFSPLSVTSDFGRTYENGLDPSGLPSLPDAVADLGGRYVAIAHDRQSLIAATSTTGRWATILTVTSLARTSVGGPCGITGFEAVATYRSLSVAALQCVRPGVVAIVAVSGGSEVGSRLALPASWNASAVSVVRLVGDADSLTVLLEGGPLDARGIIAATMSGSRWSISSVDPLARGSDLRATAIGANGSAAILVRAVNGDEIVAQVRAGALWRSQSELPAVAVAVAITSGGLDLFAAESAKLLIYQEVASHFLLRQSIEVPIEFGSSG